MRKALNTWCASHNSDKSKKRSRSPAGPRRRRKRTHAIGVHPLPPAVLSVTILLATQDCAVAGGGKAPVSACKPLCAIFLRKPRVYPLSSVKANVGHLCEKLKNAMRNGWGQRCDGNFAGYFSSADKWGVTENREMYVYKSVAESKVANVVIGAISLATQSPAVSEGEKAPCFGVCALVCDPFPKGECVRTFARESERGPFVREVEKRNQKWFGTALWR